MNIFWLFRGGSPFFGKWYVVVDTFWLVVGGGEYILAGVGWRWMVVGGSGWWWIYFGWWWVVVGGGGYILAGSGWWWLGVACGGWWHSLV